MGPRPPGGAKASSKNPKSKGRSKGSSAGTISSAPKPKPAGKRPPPKQLKTKPGAHNPTKAKKKQKTYTDKELGLPTLNMITPAGVQKPRGKKKGKIFVDDRESMMTILAMVNAEKEGQIESKMMKARQMEEIRDARKQEAEAKHERRNEKLEETKKSFKKKRHDKGQDKFGTNKASNAAGEDLPYKRPRKRVSFA